MPETTTRCLTPGAEKGIKKHCFILVFEAVCLTLMSKVRVFTWYVHRPIGEGLMVVVDGDWRWGCFGCVLAADSLTWTLVSIYIYFLNVVFFTTDIHKPDVWVPLWMDVTVSVDEVEVGVRGFNLVWHVWGPVSPLGHGLLDWAR